MQAFFRNIRAARLSSGLQIADCSPPFPFSALSCLFRSPDSGFQSPALLSFILRLSTFILFFSSSILSSPDCRLRFPASIFFSVFCLSTFIFFGFYLVFPGLPTPVSSLHLLLCLLSFYFYLLWLLSCLYQTAAFGFQSPFSLFPSPYSLLLTILLFTPFFKFCNKSSFTHNRGLAENLWFPVFYKISCI